MSVQEVPTWCRWRSGHRPLLLIAPHGGSAATTHPRAVDTKVNDVYTGDFTWALAQAIDAAAIVNPVLDRNVLDLNRISQVTRAAPWFPALIERLLATLLETHSAVDVVFIHGWNVIQPKCDIGIGARFENDADATHLTQLTVRPDYVAERLALLRARCATVGVHTSYGERYPASHRNNVLQLFRHDGTRSCDTAPRLCEWAAGDRLNAVQLELGVPLRWPGRLRQAFTHALIDTFGNGMAKDGGGRGARRAETEGGVPSDEAAHLEIRPPRSASEGRDVVSPTMLLAYDARAQLGFMSGLSLQPDGRLGGRLLVFSHTQTMALFTGEDAAQRGTVIGGPVFATHDGITDLSFSGNLLEVRDAAAYVRLEHAFMQSRLIDADLRLSFAPTNDDSFGRIHGTVRLDGTTHQIDTFGFRDVPIFLRRPGAAATRCSIAVSFRGELGLHVTTMDEDSMTWSLHQGQRTETQPGQTQITEERHLGSQAPGRLVLMGLRTLVVQPLNYMQIHRPLPNGGGEMIFLGLARCGLESGSAEYGFYEYVRPVDRVTEARPAEHLPT